MQGACSETHLDGAVVRASGHPAPVGTELELIEAAAVALVRVYAAPLPAVPELEVGVQGARSKKLADHVEIQALDHGPVPRERAHDFGLLQIPKLERSRLGSSQDMLFHVVEGHAGDGRGVAREGEQGSGLADGPDVNFGIVSTRYKNARALAPHLHAVCAIAVRDELLQLVRALRGRCRHRGTALQPVYIIVLMVLVPGARLACSRSEQVR